MSEVCGKETSSLRKHCVGKWLNNANDLKHLVLALKLQPGASAYLKENLEEMRDATGAAQGRDRLRQRLGR